MARILIVEDDVHVMRLMAMWLSKSGHDVLEAVNGVEAKQQLSNGVVDCLVTDINMPQCNGIELVRWLRLEKDLRMPVILLSARCDQEELTAKLSNLEVAIYPKPFSPSRLLAEINHKLACTTGAPGKA